MRLGFGFGVTSFAALTRATGGVLPPAGDEAVIDPPNTTARSTYALTDAGTIQSRPSGMSNSGPYWPSFVDVRTDPFWQPLGIKWLCYWSTDHSSGDGGIYLSLSINDDPKVLSGWRTYGAALAEGLFASVPTKPASNPVYVYQPGSNLSTETPHVRKQGSTWVLTFQTYKLSNSQNQCTNRVLSTDGLNWTGTLTAPLLQIPDYTRSLGDGHTGYFRWGPNPFDRTAVPFDFVGYSLGGGGDKPLFAQWGTNDPVAGDWTFIQPLSPQYGRLGDASFGPTGADIANARAVRQGIAIVGDRSAGGSGTANQYGTISEGVLDMTGTLLHHAPIDLVAMPLNSDVASQASIANVMTRDDERVIVYQGTRAPDANTHVNSVAIAASPRRNSQNTYFDALSPARPSALTTQEFDFRTLTDMPAYFSLFNNGSPTVVFDPSSGLRISHPSAGSVRNYVLYGAEIAATVDFVDFYLHGLRSGGSGAFRTIGLGFAVMDPGAALLGLANHDGLYLRTGGTGNVGVKARKVAGTESTNALTRYPTLSYNTSSRPYAWKNIGLRWFRAAGRCFLLGEGPAAYGIETEELIVPAELKPGGSLYGKVVRPYFGLVTQASTANVEAVHRFRARWG